MTTVLVTGASSGIGEATARLFAANGYRVFGTSRQPHRSEHGIEMLRLDVRSEDSVTSCVEAVLDLAGQIDVLINNAGVMVQGIVEETTMREAHTAMETNFFGVARTTAAVLPGMRDRRQGRIINVGSLAACVGEPSEAFYSASKAALARYTEALRHEVWSLGIKVSLVEPGAFETNVLRAAHVTESRIAAYDHVRESVHRVFEQSLRRGGDPADVAALIFRVARARSPLSRYGAGADARWLPRLRAALPQRVFDRLLRKGFGL